MKIAVAGDSAGENLAHQLVEYLADNYDVVEVSHTQSGPDKFYAQLADRVASEVVDGKYDRAILVCGCLLYTSPSPRDRQKSRMPSSA